MEYENLYTNCTQCPRNCKINRNEKKGFCTQDKSLVLASACLHFGEEPLITVKGGSGTLFFTGCTLKCAFCQNYQISQKETGAPVSTEDFVKVCLKLQEMGAENINLVTGSHHIPRIAHDLEQCKKSGLQIPVAWNSSGYESVESLELLKGLVDIWLPDFKTINPTVSRDLFAAPDYPSVAKAAVEWMIRNSTLKIENEKILEGTIIRHLFLPGKLDDTIETLQWLKEKADGKAIISLMSQYTPVPFAEEECQLQKRQKALAQLENRLVTPQEDEDLKDIIEAFEFEYLFYQDLSDDTTWLPDFTRTQPFSYKLAKPVWHYSCGFIE